MDEDKGTTKTRDDSGYASAGADQAEAFANDPANSSRNFAEEAAGNKSRLSSGMSAIKNGISNNPGKAKAAGIGGGIATLLLAGFIALLPLKLEAIMKNIFQHRIGDKVEHLMERRADKILIRGLIQSGAEEGVYSNGKLLTSLYRNWKIKGFEKKFSAKSGIKIESLKGGGIRLTTPDGVKPSTFSNAEDFEKYLAKGDLKGVDARKFIRDVTRSETHWIQIYKRANLRRYMRNAYGITKWSWFTGKSGEEGKANVRGALIDDALKPYNEQTPKVIDCALEGKTCPKDDGERKASYGDEPAGSLDPKPADPEEADRLKEGSQAAASEAAEETKKAGKKSGIVNKALTTVLTKIVGERIATAVTSKVLPIIGQILMVDMFSRIDHFFESGSADKAIRTVHKLQYARQFAAFQSMADNFKDPGPDMKKKQMSGDEVNEVMTKLGDPSKSKGFQEIFLNSDGGKGLDDDLAISDNGTNNIRKNYKKATDLNPVNITLRSWYKATHTVGLDKVIDLINKALGGVLEVALKVLLIPAKLEIKAADAILGTNLAGYIEKGKDELGALFKDVMLAAIKPAVDGTETDGDLFSGIDAGASLVGEDYCKSLGCHELTTGQSTSLLHAIALEKSQTKPTLIARLFSPDYNDSVINRLAVVTPASGSQAITQFSDYSVAILKSPFSIFSGILNSFIGKAHADTPRNIYGLKDYGYTEAELDQPLQLPEDNNNDGKINQEDCEYNSDGSKIENFNDLSLGRMCLLDVATVEGLNSYFTDDDDGGIGNNSSTTPATTVLTGELPSGTAQQLAKILLDSPNVAKNGRLVTQDLQDTAAGRSASSGAPISQTLLAILVKLAETHKIDISALESGGSGHTSSSLHYVGDAVDLRAFDGAETNGRDAASISLLNTMGPFLPKGSGVGQVNCPGGKPSLPSYIDQFDDSCTHVHIELPRGTP